MYTAVLLLAGLVQVSRGPDYPDWDQSKGLFLSDIYLVRAKAIKIERRRERGGTYETATFLIEHVYVGEGTVKGQTFQLELASPLGLRPTTMDDFISLKEGEIGIWWIIKGSRSKRLVSTVRYNLYLDRVGGFGPARDVPRDKTFDPLGSPFGGFYFHCNPYAKGLAWAEKYEKLYKTAPKDQPTLLMRYAREKDPLLAGRAVGLLAFCGLERKDYEKRLQELAADKTLSIGAQVAIDRALFWAYYPDEERLKAWYRSADFMRLLRNWVSADLGDADTKAILELQIIRRLHSSIPRSDKITMQYLKYEPVLEIALIGLANQKRSDSFKDALVYMARDCRPEGAAERKKGFDLLKEIIESDKPRNTRIAAARLLTTLKRLPGDQREAVQAIMKREEDPLVVRYLQDAVTAETKRENKRPANDKKEKKGGNTDGRN